MRKNVAGQSVNASLVATADGSPVTSGTTTVYVEKDGAAQVAGVGTAPAHKGNGSWSYAPTQAETDADHVVFTFVNASAIVAVVNVYTVDDEEPFDPEALVQGFGANWLVLANGANPGVDRTGMTISCKGQEKEITSQDITDPTAIKCFFDVNNPWRIDPEPGVDTYRVWDKNVRHSANFFKLAVDSDGAVTLAAPAPTTDEILAAFQAFTPALRDLSNVAAPTWEDCQAAAFLQYAGDEADDGATWVRRLPDGTPGRTFTLTTDSVGNVTARS